MANISLSLGVYRLSASDNRAGDDQNHPRSSPPRPPDLRFVTSLVVVGYSSVVFLTSHSAAPWLLPVSSVPYCVLGMGIIYAWRFGPDVPVNLSPESRPLLVICRGLQSFLDNLGKAAIELARPRDGNSSRSAQASLLASCLVIVACLLIVVLVALRLLQWGESAIH